AGLAGGQPEIGRRVEPAGEDVRRPPEGRVRLVPGDPRDRAARAGEVDRRRFGVLGRIDVERRGKPLRYPGAVLERTHEDLLRAAGDLLLERRPRDLGLPGRARPAGDVGDARVLARIDRVRGIVVDLRAARRERQECGVYGGRREQRTRGGERGEHQGNAARAGDLVRTSKMHGTSAPSDLRGAVSGRVASNAPSGPSAAMKSCTVARGLTPRSPRLL